MQTFKKDPVACAGLCHFDTISAFINPNLGNFTNFHIFRIFQRVTFTQHANLFTRLHERQRDRERETGRKRRSLKRR
jgi:hypothetical protein